MEYGNDAADQLTAAVKKSTDPTPTILQRFAYGYDPAGNRTGEQIDDALTGATHNNVNELVSQQPAGALRVEGTVNEPATVTVNGAPALVTADNRFVGTTPIVAGTNTFTVAATDGSGNTATETYHVDSAGSTKAFTYDANGNMTSDGTRTFEWDARNQLVAINVGTDRTEFSYDGQQRRARVVEKDNGVVESDARLVWCEAAICEERAADGITILRTVFSEAVQDQGTPSVLTAWFAQ